MHLEILMRCKLSKESSLLGGTKEKWLKEGLRLRLTVDDSNYFGFPLFIKEVEYNSLDIVVRGVLLTNKEYGRDYFLEKKEFNLVVATKAYGRCKVVEVKELK